MSRRWSPAEDKKMACLFGKIKAAQLARILDRSTYAVDSRARALGLARKRRDFTEEEIQFMRDNAHHMTRSQMGEKLGRTLAMVHKACQRLEIPPRPRAAVERKVVALALDVPPNEWWYTSLEEGLHKMVSSLVGQLRYRNRGGLITKGDLFSAAYLLMCAHPDRSWRHCKLDLYDHMMGVHSGTPRHGEVARALGLAFSLSLELDEVEGMGKSAATD